MDTFKLKKYLRTPTETEKQNFENDLKHHIITEYIFEIILTGLLVLLLISIKEINYSFFLLNEAIFVLFLFIEIYNFIKKIKAVKAGDYFLGECEAIKYKFETTRGSSSIYCETTAILTKNQHVKIITSFEEEYAEEAFLKGNKTFTLFLIKNKMYTYVKLDNGKTFTSNALFIPER